MTGLLTLILLAATTGLRSGERVDVSPLVSAIGKRVEVARMILPRSHGGDQPELISHIFQYVAGLDPQHNAASLWRQETQETYILLHQKHLGRGPRPAKQSWAASSQGTSTPLSKCTR